MPAGMLLMPRETPDANGDLAGREIV